MKKKNLKLNKETIANLNKDEMTQVKGGQPLEVDAWGSRAVCLSFYANCTDDSCKGLVCIPLDTDRC